MEVVLVAVVLLTVVALLVGTGFVWAREELAADREAVEQQRQALDAEWQALENGRRVNDVFFQARQAMREAARERRPRP
jgi:cell division protein FtsL